MPLTDLAIKQAKPKSRDGKLSDSKISDGGGLFLLVTKAGGKLWKYSYRYEGKQKTLALGAYPEICLKDARERHLQARKLLAEGIDPSEHRKAIKVEQAKIEFNTFKQWADKWLTHWKAGKSPRHAGYVERRLEADVYPVIGNLPIQSINAPDIVRTIKSIASRGALDMAKRAHQTIGQVFRYAIAHGDESGVIRNPTTDIKPSDIIETRRKVNYARIESRELPGLLRAIDAASISSLTRLAIKLMALTFVRTSELIGGKWSEIDFDSAQWRVPADRMKMKTPHIVPLSYQAVEVLHTLKIITGSGNTCFPFRLQASPDT